MKKEKFCQLPIQDLEDYQSRFNIYKQIIFDNAIHYVEIGKVYLSKCFALS